MTLVKHQPDICQRQLAEIELEWTVKLEGK